MSNSAQDADIEQDLWAKLLDWLVVKHGFDASSLQLELKPREGAGYGLFALEQIKPSSILFTIPASALMNHKTLRALYPSHPPNGSELTAFQIISLHLSLHRPVGSEESTDPLFGPYISVLPRDFTSHPLTWLVERKLGLHSETGRFLDALPVSVSHLLEKALALFSKDWDVVKQYASPRQLYPRDLDENSVLATLNYLWAWLNVNTRCVFHRLEPSSSHENNMTLCPLLDFLNHTVRADESVSPINPGHRCGRDMTLVTPAIDIHPGQELYLKYGAHPNRTLFVEYGFIDGSKVSIGAQETERQPDSDASSLEADIEAEIEELLHLLPPAQFELVKECLTTQGYWGDWTLHRLPGPAHPSYRVIACLRLITLVSHSSLNTESQVIEQWTSVINGESDQISDLNESQWKTLLRDICQSVSSRASNKMKAMDADTSYVQASEQPWQQRAWSTIKELWAEIAIVASGVLRSLDDGEEF